MLTRNVLDEEAIKDVVENDASKEALVSHPHQHQHHTDTTLDLLSTTLIGHNDVAQELGPLNALSGFYQRQHASRMALQHPECVVVKGLARP